MKNLKVYDPDPEKSFTKAKVAMLKQEQTEHNLPDIENVATNHLNKFPTADSAFTNDFSLLPKFVPTDTLKHLKNCGKNTSRKLDDTFVEFASSKGLRLFPFVHDVQVTTDNSENHIIYLRALCWRIRALFDPRPSKWRKLDVESVGMLKQNLQKVNPAVPFSKMIPDVNDIVLIDTIVGKVAKGSLLHLQLKEIGTNIQPSVNGCSSNSLSSVSRTWDIMKYLLFR